MASKNINFEYAQLLYSEYSTNFSNKSVYQQILKTLGDKFVYENILENSVSPREFLNQFILNYYPNESTIKSSFINNVLLKSKNHVTIFELKVGQSRLDLCKINGNSIAFEIKSELDTPKRLKQQMTDYFQVFEKVYLICPEDKIKIMKNEIPENCGIYTYNISRTGRYRFKIYKAAMLSQNISSNAQLSSLTKNDLKFYFDCPEFENKQQMIEFIIENRTKKNINTTFKLCLKKKYSLKWNFLIENKNDILEIDYQWFFKNQISPKIVYS